MKLFSVSRSGKNHELFSGKHSHFRINAEYLEESELEEIAWLFAQTTTFGFVISIPTGGNKFAELLRKYITKDNDTVLIVDDVFTSGKSMQTYKDLFDKERNVRGVVIFSRGQTPEWITSIFQLPHIFAEL